MPQDAASLPVHGSQTEYSGAAVGNISVLCAAFLIVPPDYVLR